MAVDELLERSQARVTAARATIKRLEFEVEQFGLGAQEAQNEETKRFYVQLQVDCRNQIKAEHARADSMSEELAGMTARSKAMKDAHKTSHWMQRTLATIASISMVSANAGFLVWYQKSQKYQDHATEIDAELKVLELQLKRLELKSKVDESKAKRPTTPP